MKRPSIYATAVAGFSLQATPAAYARRILDQGPEADLHALIGDMNAAYVRVKVDVEGEEQAKQSLPRGETPPRAPGREIAAAASQPTVDAK
ncbi:MAG: hypothetical protein M3619_00515 [Myxococcota bacterium]|nr:hypothetical protein [Myxococcota bacterium]